MSRLARTSTNEELPRESREQASFKIVPLIFFQREHGNESCNLIGSSRGPDFPISDHGHGNGGKQRG